MSGVRQTMLGLEGWDQRGIDWFSEAGGVVMSLMGPCEASGGRFLAQQMRGDADTF
jgi:hypothetical protein